MFVQIRREKEGEEGLFPASEIPSNLVWLYILFQTFCHRKAIVKITPEQLSRAWRWGSDWRERSSVERDMGILVGNVLNTSEQCALTMNTSCILGFISKAVASRSTQAVIPPCLVLWDSHLKDCVQIWALCYRHWHTGVSPAEGYQNGWGLEHTAYKKRLTEMGLFSLEKRRCRGNLTVVYSYLMGNFSKVHSNGMQAPEPKLEQKNIWLDFRKNIFTIRGFQHWPRLPRVFGKSWGYSKLNWPWTACSNWTSFEHWVGQDDLQRTFSTQIILWYYLESQKEGWNKAMSSIGAVSMCPKIWVLWEIEASRSLSMDKAYTVALNSMSPELGLHLTFLLHHATVCLPLWDGIWWTQLAGFTCSMLHQLLPRLHPTPFLHPEVSRLREVSLAYIFSSGLHISFLSEWPHVMHAHTL